MIKQLVKFVFIFLIMGISVACDNEFKLEEHRAGRLLMHLDFTQFKDVKFRSPGSDAERTVTAIDVIFFNEAGNKIKLLEQANFSLFYDVANPTPAQWKNENKATQTLVLPISAGDALGKTVLVLANLSTTLRAELEKEANQTLAQIKALAQQQTTVEELTTPLIMVAEKKLTTTEIPNVDTETTINVLLERTVAKLDIILHYEWENFVPNHATLRGKYTMKDFSGTTYLWMPSTAQRNIVARVDGAANTLIPKTTLPAQQATSKITAYINEYSLENPFQTVPSPYILFDLPSVLGTPYTGPVGPLPPPAGGGDEFDGEIRSNFYRLVMPRTILRNHYYTIHAVILGEGAPTPEEARTLTFEFTVLPWDTEIFPSNGDPSEEE